MKKKNELFDFLKGYWKWIAFLFTITFLLNMMTLTVPIIISRGIDVFIGDKLDKNLIIKQFSIVIFCIFIFSVLQNFLQVYLSEKVAKDLRDNTLDKISEQNYSYIESMDPSKILTNFTVDIDSVKRFSGAGIAQFISSIITSVGATIVLMIISWKLALCVLFLIPIMMTVFLDTFKKMKTLHIANRSTIDRLNMIINETIHGATVVRIINSRQNENGKFLIANLKVRQLYAQTYKIYLRIIPLIPFTRNLSTLMILGIGGLFVIHNEMSIGELIAFVSYVDLILFPIIMLSNMSSDLAEVFASFKRLEEVPTVVKSKNEIIKHDFQDEIKIEKVSKSYGEKMILKNISFNIKQGSKTAIVGPTAAGKTQLLYMFSGLVNPDSGTIKFDNNSIKNFNTDLLQSLIGFVFQDNIIFNTSIGENIAFSNTVTEGSLKKAIETSELKEFIDSLPDKLDTLVFERGARLSEGQKQRIMLARALAVNPKILLLDDFTARVDNNTGKRIYENIKRNYPELTIISVSQNMNAMEDYDQIILMMQGEIIGVGTHENLMSSSTEYLQLFNSQESITSYELQS